MGESVDEALRTALDLCLGLGAFAVSMTGVVHRVTADAMAPEDAVERIEALARSCLAHPAAHGNALFWNAEVSTEAGSADRSLACVVVPVRAGSAQLGLLGVVDTWLPEPDDHQRAGLERIAAAVARILPHGSPAPGGRPSHVVHTGGADDGGVPVATDGAVAAVAIDATELIAHLDDGVMCLDASGTVVLANRAADALHGLPPDRTLVGSPLPMATALRTEDGHVLAHDHHPAVLTLRDGDACVAHLTVGEHGAGQRHVAASARPFRIGDQMGVLVVMRDTTAEWIEQQRLTHYALYDPLTGLANRYLLLEELRRMLQGLGRRGGSVALVYMDLDDFKHINDDYGHDMGDEVLGAVARRLRGAVRSDDVVARLGGDEFVIAHATAERLPDGDLVVSRLRKVLSAPFRVRGQAFDVGASIGWVSTDKGDVGPDALLAKADRAMYRHKRDRAVARRGTT